MRIEKCFFCSSSVYPGHGVEFVRNDCKVFRFCRGKCHKAFKRKKNPRKTRWTKAYRKTNGKELTVDPAFEFEKRRHVPVKYDREVWEKTIDAMKRVEEIKVKRQNQYVLNRLKVGKKLRKEDDIKVYKTQIHLIQSPAATKKGKAFVEIEEDNSEGEMDFEEAEEVIL